MSGLKRVWMCAAAVAVSVCVAQSQAAVVIYKTGAVNDAAAFFADLGGTDTTQDLDGIPAGVVFNTALFAPNEFSPTPGVDVLVAHDPDNPFADDLESVDIGGGDNAVRSTDVSALTALILDFPNPGVTAFGFELSALDNTGPTIEFFDTGGASLGSMLVDIGQNNNPATVFVGGITNMGDELGEVRIQQDGAVRVRLNNLVTGTPVQTPTPGPQPGPTPGGGIPEPASMSLLAVGGLVMLRRRRSAA